MATYSSKKYPSGSVTSATLADGSVVAVDLADGAVTSAKLNSTVDLSGKTVTYRSIVAGDIASNAITSAKMANSGAELGMRNRIINGAMTIDQRNAGTAVTINTTSNTYVMDRWRCRGESSDGVYTCQQVSDAPAGFKNSSKITVTTADASVDVGKVYGFQQWIEGFNIADLDWGTANAKPITISFWVRSSITGTFGGGVTNGSLNRSYPFTYTISAANTWEQKSVTITGDTSGTWASTNTAALRLNYNIGAGSENIGTAGAWNSDNDFSATGAVDLINTLNATWFITGVQLEVGSTATSFDYRPYGTEFQLCQRYYEKSYNVDVAPGTNTGAGDSFLPLLYANASVLDYGGNCYFKVSKRANPTIAYWKEEGTSNVWSWFTGSSSGTATPVTNRSGTNSFTIYATGSGFSNTTYIAAGQWTASSEL